MDWLKTLCADHLIQEHRTTDKWSCGNYITHFFSLTQYHYSGMFLICLLFVLLVTVTGRLLQVQNHTLAFCSKNCVFTTLSCFSFYYLYVLFIFFLLIHLYCKVENISTENIHTCSLDSFYKKKMLLLCLIYESEIIFVYSAFKVLKLCFLLF